MGGSAMSDSDSYLHQEDFLTPGEVAALLRVSPRTVRNWIYGDALRACQFGSQWRIERLELEAFIRRHRR